MLALNIKHLNHSTHTDIISFDYSSKRTLRAEFFISPWAVSRSADEYSQSIVNEMLRVVSHGVLHCLGFKDKSDTDKSLMRCEENKFINMFHVKPTSMFDSKYDVIVVGAGHAGCEAAAAAANLGSSTLLITMNLQTIAQMSCNPAMGGIAKGQIVREIDALGGYSGIVSDRSAIQYKMLNQSKGPAMWSPRVQSDRSMFSLEWRSMLEKTPNLDFYQEMIVDLIVENQQILGVITSLGIKIYAKSVVLTNGTFLNGLIHIGEKNFGGGRAGESASVGLNSSLGRHWFSIRTNENRNPSTS